MINTKSVKSYNGDIKNAGGGETIIYNRKPIIPPSVLFFCTQN